MKFLSLALVVLALAVAGCNEAKQVVAAQTNRAVAPAVSPLPYLTNAQPRLPTIQVFVGREELTAELAVRQVEIFTGMMWRTNLPESEAMLFVFGTPQPRGFYMRNTLVPLSLAYLSPDGVIQEIHDLHPLNEASVPSRAENIQYVLEVAQGWFKRHNITTGMVLNTARGELARSLPRPQVP